MRWRDLKVGLKLAVGFGIMIVLIIVAGATGFQGIQSIGKALFIVGEEEAPLVDMANEMKISLWASRNALEEYKSATAALATDDRDALSGIVADYNQTLEDFDTFFSAIIDGGMVGDHLVLKTDNQELAGLVREADSVHDSKFQKAAERMMEEGQSLLEHKAELALEMDSLEAVYEEVLDDATAVEELISGEIESRSTAAGISSEALAILREEVPLVDLANEIKISMAMTRITMEEFVQQADLNDLDEIKSEYVEWIAVFDRNVDAILNGGTVEGKRIFATDNSQIRQRLEELDSDHAKFQEEAAKMMEAYEEMLHQAALAEAAMAELDGYGDETSAILDRVEELAGNEMLQARIAGNGAKANAILVLLIVIGISIAFGVLIGTVIARGISRPLQEGVHFADKLSRGDLSAELKLDRGDEVGLLARALQTMTEKLKEVISDALSGAEQIASASEQLAMGNQDLSVRTEQQATALEETSSAIEEMNSSIRSNADNTKSADQLSRDALEKSVEGSGSFKNMISSMEDISISSNRIADIIEVINNIAFQTNLLALNASIEAARAGEQGKGFAVVAVEVRKLAKRSDKAASEIAEIIKNSNRKVDEGVQIANTAGKVLEEINGAVKKVTALVGEISASSQEQLSSVDQIDRTLSSLDENTQKNAALVEEAASSTEELSGQAQELNSNMQFFKLGGRHAAGSGKIGKTTGIALLEKKTAERDSEPVQDKDYAASVETGAYEVFSSMDGDNEFAEF